MRRLLDVPGALVTLALALLALLTVGILRSGAFIGREGRIRLIARGELTEEIARKAPQRAGFEGAIAL
ncbi:MAG: hypothetical protein AB7G37_11190 [Solirubrobacteraceae bacterium]